MSPYTGDMTFQFSSPPFFLSNLSEGIQAHWREIQRGKARQHLLRGMACHNPFSTSPLSLDFGHAYACPLYVFQTARSGTRTRQMAMWDPAALTIMPLASPAFFLKDKWLASVCLRKEKASIS